MRDALDTLAILKLNCPSVGCPRPSLAEQPAPEVLYLCTTCGDILRGEEDGRWQRRRRPSSAPAVGRRSAPHDGDSSSKRTAKRCQILPDGSSVDHVLEEGRSEITVAQESYEVGRSQRRSTKIKLQYARCARTIQHAYKDFRHQQYLRDWALRVVSDLGAPYVVPRIPLLSFVKMLRFFYKQPPL